MFKKKKVEEELFKESEEPKLTESEIKILKQLSFLQDYIKQMQHDLLLGKITTAEYEKEVDIVGKKVDALENLKAFDDMMGSPYVTFPEIFGEDAFDKMVHDAIEECDESTDTETETDKGLLF